jgi:DNA-binding transcriptional ArsR family regulator
MLSSMAESNGHFDSSRAELFEALGHPTRIKILRALDGKPMSFSELKRETGIDSSGHLQFHLGKLSGLIKTDETGNYMLTDDGREALHVAQTALRTDAMLKNGENSISRPFLISIVTVSIVWALIMIATSIELQGSAFNSVVVILGIGFIACLLVLVRLGRR